MIRIVDPQVRSVFRGQCSKFRRQFAVTALVVLMAGCGDSVTPGGTIDAATTIDAAIPQIDAPVIADAGTPTPAVFRLTYSPLGPITVDDAIFVQIACSQMWVSVIDDEGNHMPIDSDCGTCSCESCDSCAVCDCALLIEPINAGASRDHAWDGLTHPTVQRDGCGFCSLKSTLAPGTYTARFCYSRSVDGAQECGEQTFDYPLTTLVEHVVMNASP